MILKHSFIIGLLFTSVSMTSLAQVAAPPTPEIVAPQNIAYAGTLKVHADLTDLDRRIIRVRETIPVSQSGDLVLMLPKWLPGKHHPLMQNITRVAGLKVMVDGADIGWKRDALDMNAFHIDVPSGAKSVEVEFEYLAPTRASTGRIVMTSEMANLQWDFASLYPSGYYVSNIQIEASVKLPEGWQAGTALDVASVSADNTIIYKPVSYETLIDSPMFAGKYFKRILLNEGADKPVYLNAVADSADMLTVSDDALAAHKKLVVQAGRLYGAYHFNHYDFLVAASEKIGGIGLEHHRSSENRVDTKYFTDWKGAYVGHDLLPHEFTHSWNGKHRRGDDLWTPNYQVPMRDSLLWVYEGQTQYWGTVLSARSDFYTKDQALELLAQTAAYFDQLPGREWRSVDDTTNDPIISGRAPKDWSNYQRSEDYYNEGLLIWLDVDTLIREKTGGKKSLDDFAKAFFGKNDGVWTVDTYNFETVVMTLNSVYPYDWAEFLNERLTQKSHSPLDGVKRGGYSLVYSDTPTALFKANEAKNKISNLSYSIGLIVTPDNMVTSVWWDSPAFKAGIVPGATLVAINGKAATNDGLKAAITASKASKTPIEIIYKTDDNFKTVSIFYFEGLKYPKLERIAGQPAYLDNILAEKK